MKKCLACILLLALLLGLFSGCAAPAGEEQAPQQTPSAAPEQERDEPVTAPEQPALAVELSGGFDPYSTTSSCNRFLLELVLEPLFSVSPAGQAEAVLAESWNVSADGLTTLVTLKPDIVLHDGTVLTAEAVVSSVEKAMAGSYYHGRFYALQSVRSQGERTVEFVTTVAYECFPLLLDIPIASGSDTLPVGTGPYLWNGTESLLPHAGWHGEVYPAGKQAITLQPVSDATALRDGFQFGGVSAVSVDPNGTGSVGYNGEYELWKVPTAQMQYVGFNRNRGVFSSEKIRSAVTWAVDRQSIVDEDMAGFGVPAVLATLPGSVWDDPQLSEGYGFEPEKLTAVLPAGAAATMIVCGENAQRTASARRIAQQLTACGLTTTLKTLTAAQFRSALASGSYDLYYAEVRLSPNLDLTPFFAEGGELSYGGLADETLLQLCQLTLNNRGNAYDLQRRILSRGLVCPVAFKANACYLHLNTFELLSPSLGGWLW